MKFRIPARLAVVGMILSALPGASPAQGQTGQGFLFKAPRLEVTARGGVGFASAASDLFDFTREQLTVSRGDFTGVSLAGDLNAFILPRLSLVLTGGYIGSNTESEFRDWVGEDDLPIYQTTEFQRVPLTAGLRLYPLPTGRKIGSYAWIPARVVPYVGGGAGLMWYQFRQSGDFVDNETLDIFFDELRSAGWTPTAEGFGGLTVTLSPRWSVVGEGRYTWAHDELSDSFEGFEPIDLAGLSVTVGASYRF